RLADLGLQLEALVEDPALLVHDEVHRADHPVTSALAQPVLGRRQQSVEYVGVVFELEKAEQAPAVALELVERPIDLDADPAHHPPVAPGEEQLGLAMAEEGIQLAVQ